MFWSFDKRKICSTALFAVVIGTVPLLMSSCAMGKNDTLECVANHMLANIEKEKIEDFIELEGIIIWREGWENMTSGIAKDHYVIEECNIRQYLTQYNLSLDDIKGQMIFIYSMHSYLKHGKVNQEAIEQKVNSLFFKG